MNTPVVDFVRRYAQQRTTRMHMPGHKGRGPLGCEELDITEIAGADELYEAEGIIAQSEANATQLFGTARTYYSTEGSSQCIRAMLHLALQMRPAKADRPVLLAARNAHKALLYAAALLDFDIQWLWPAPDAAGALCTCPVEPEALSSALDELSAEGRTPFGVYLTSPDYLGFVQDVAGLSAVCHAHGLPLLVDNAHGAYLHFLKEGSRHPIQLGADLCCDSAHKTLPVLTGGAYLHLGSSVQADEAAVRNALALFGSTSPSYLILQSLDAANAVLADSFREKLDICRWRLGMLCRELDAIRPGLALPLTGAHREPLKLTLDAAALGLSGQQLAQALRERGVECEYADPRYVVLMPSAESSAAEFACLQTALHAICDEAPAADVSVTADDPAAFAALAGALEAQPRRFTIREAVLAPQEMIPAAEVVGRIRRLFNGNGVMWQMAELGKTDAGGGGPVAKYMAKRNIDTLDAGVPVLSMHAPYFDGAKLLVAADCTAYAYGNFHNDFIDGHVTLIGCPKLDSVDYSEKLTEIIKNNEIQSVTVVRMEVPCCGGIEAAVKNALMASGKFIPWQVYTIGTDGRILK